MIILAYPGELIIQADQLYMRWLYCALAMIPFLFMVQTQLVIEAEQLYVLFELAELPGGVHLPHDRLSRRFGRGCDSDLRSGDFHRRLPLHAHRQHPNRWLVCV